MRKTGLGVLARSTMGRVGRCSSSGIPERQAPSEDDLDGRGLAIVEGLATQWGYYHARQGGKVVWAELALPPAEPWLSMPNTGVW